MGGFTVPSRPGFGAPFKVRPESGVVIADYIEYTLSTAGAVISNADKVTTGPNGGIQFTVATDTTSSDPGNGVWVAWPLLDEEGARVTWPTSEPRKYMTGYARMIKLAVSSSLHNVYGGVGLADTSDLSGAANMIGWGLLEYSGGRRVRTQRILAGTATSTEATVQSNQAAIVDGTWTHQFPGYIGVAQATGLKSTGLITDSPFDSASAYRNQVMQAAGGAWLVAYAGCNSLIGGGTEQTFELRAFTMQIRTSLSTVVT